MLLGEHKHAMDPKGRVAIPVRFRSKFDAGAIITRGLDRCLFVFGMQEWEKLVQKITALPLSQSNSRAFSRLMLAGAAEVQFDGQGRVLIPDYLRKYANLDKQVVVAGVYNRMEIWNEELWNDYKAKTESASDDIAEQLGELGV